MASASAGAGYARPRQVQLSCLGETVMAWSGTPDHQSHDRCPHRPLSRKRARGGWWVAGATL